MQKNQKQTKNPLRAKQVTPYSKAKNSSNHK